MQVNNTLKQYNIFLLNSFQRNKFTTMFFFTVSVFGYFSLPYLEKYHKSIKEKNSKDSFMKSDEQKTNDESKK